MGGGVSKRSAAQGLQPTLGTTTALTIRLLESLAAKEDLVSLPILSNSERQRSGRRGMSRDLLFGVRAFYAQRGALDKMVQDIIDERLFPFSACELTKSTGLSLQETLVLEAGEGEGIEELVGEATCFFSYSCTGTTLRNLLDAVERVLAKLETDGTRRYVWIDILCASQNLLQGVIKDPAMSSAEVSSIEEAISTAGELLFYMEPLAGEWPAPPHPFLLAEQGEPAEGWVRRGPAALTRAWCIYELAKSLTMGCKLHVLFNDKSVAQFEDKMHNDAYGFLWIGQILGRVDVKQAQVTKAEDRDYILSEVGKLPGGMGAVNSSVMAALGGWVVDEAQAMLAAVPEAERGTSGAARGGRDAPAGKAGAAARKGRGQPPEHVGGARQPGGQPAEAGQVGAGRATDARGGGGVAQGQVSGHVMREEGKLKETVPLLVEAVARPGS
eukprot:scaffold1228_cov66-Phaeocystis_antarctica.AAC.1